MRASKVLIHLAHLKHNLSIIRKACPNSLICLAVKADAYGHGAVPIARAALDFGVYALGVATADEAFELRKATITAPILLYGIPAPQEISALIAADIELFCTDTEFQQLLINEALVQKKKVRIHLKIDTGMGRIGCSPQEALALALATQSASTKGSLEIAGICTHLPVSDDTDTTYTSNQLDRFLELVRTIRAHGIDTGLTHAANSGAIGLHPKAGFDMIRPGIMAYGYAPAENGFDHLDLKPVMELRTGVSFVKHVPADTPISYGQKWRTPTPRWIGTVPVGYADGLHRLAGGRFGMREVTADDGAQARIFPQVGTICMDQCMIDLGEYTEQAEESPLQRWAEVVVFGPQAGAASAADIARAAQTIPYEITCGISKRVPRVYLEASE